MRALLLFTLTVLHFYNISLHGQTCPQSDIYLNTQGEIDSFLIDYPDCAEVPHSVFIQGESIVDLRALDQLVAIDGSLIINSCISLTSLKGLDNLDEIGGNLSVSLENLTDLQGLEQLSTIGGDLSISCPNVTDFIDFNQLVTIGDDLSIVGNSRIHDLSGLQSVRNFNGIATISNNDSLLNMNGFPNVSNLELVTISDNKRLRMFEGFENVEVISSDFFIWNNLLDADSTSLENFKGLEHIKTIGGSFEITFQAVSSLEGLSGLESAESFALIGMSNLTGLDSLKNFQELNTLILNDNDQIRNLNGLNGLDTLQSLNISGHDQLESLHGLDSVQLTNANNITITENENLSECAISSLCRAIESSQVGSIIIANNEVGCSTISEVENQCVASSSNPDLRELKGFPNPTTHAYHIESNDVPLSYTIVNTHGITVDKSNELNDNKIYVDGLLPGLYVILLEFNDGTIGRSFFVKQ